MPVLNDAEFPRFAHYPALAGSQGPFAIPFPFLGAGDVAVYVNGSAIAGYSVQHPDLNGTSGNTVTLTSPLAGAATVTVMSETRPYALGQDLISREAFRQEIDRLWAGVQELHGRVDRTPNFSVLYPNAATYEYPDPVPQRIVVYGTDSFILGPLVSQLGYMADEYFAGALILMEDGRTLQAWLDDMDAAIALATTTVSSYASSINSHQNRLDSHDLTLVDHQTRLDSLTANFDWDGTAWYPEDNGTRDLGSATQRWGTIWANNIWSYGRLGYPDGKGLGETVVQDPNNNQNGKESTVAINKRSGRIITHDEQIIAGGMRSFRVNCPIMTATTIPLISIQTPKERYVANSTGVDASGFWIDIENRDTVDRSQNITLTFLLLDGTAD